MAIYYVRPDGNDGNDGSANDAAHAWLTPDFALRSGIALTGGPHTLNIFTGTYAINNVGVTGSFKFGRLYGTLLTIQTTTGAADVIFQNATAADTFMMQNSAALSNMSFNNIRFTAITGSTYCWLWKNTLNCTALSFTGCTFDAPPDAGAMQCVFTNGGNGASSGQITYTNCVFNHATGSSGYGINMNTGTGPQTFTIALTNCTCTSNFNGGFFDGAALTVNVQGGTFAVTGLNAIALILGNDTTAAGKGVTGTVYGVTCSSTQGHGFEIGDIATGVKAAGNICSGADYGVVLKNSNATPAAGTGNVVVNNRVTAGTGGGILLKGFPNSKVQGNTIFASAAPAFKDWDSGSPAGAFINTNTLTRGNRAIMTGTGTALDWAQLNGAGTQVDGGGNTTDYNTYDLRAGTLGTVNGTAAIATMAALRTAWNSQVIDTGFDLNSILATSQTLLSTHYTATGSYLYAFVKNNAGQYWNVSTSAFETYTAANISFYALPMVEDGIAYLYTCVFPLQITSGSYTVRYFVRAGSVPAGSDTQVNSDVTVPWNGTTSVYQTGDVFAQLPTGFSTLSIASGGVRTTYAMTKNTAYNNFQFDMVLASDHISPATGKTVTATRSIDGGVYAASTNSGTIAEIANGTYKVNLSAADLNGGTITFKFAATACDTTTITFVTQA